MNTYFQQSLTQVQSEEFIADFKVTIRFVIKVIKVIFLMLTGVLILAKSFYLKLSRQDVVTEPTVCNKVDSSFIFNTLENIGSVDSSLNEKAVYLPLEKDREISNSEVAIVDLINNELSNNNFTKESQLKTMKAAELKELCVGYGISYKNKSQAVLAILQKEQSMMKQLT
ncbi:hypothetical protein [Nodularia chucula]|uniref:hypothetical protein n=1 Tax=Nodularia chucula TaxID=3093667 RepID=UPI0039C5D211